MAKRRAQKHTRATPRNNWCSPAVVLGPARYVLDGIDLDPAGNAQSIVGARVSIYHADFLDGADYTIPDHTRPGVVWGDGLSVSWSGHRNAWINPPYGRTDNKRWAAKIASEAAQGLECIALVPANVGTQWFANYWRAQAICFWAGRLRFEGAPDIADFESAVVYFGPRADRFAEAYGSLGHVVRGER